MRTKLLVGLALAVAMIVVMVMSSWLDLDLESVAVFGVLVGAVVALVPDRSVGMRLAGFAAGVVVALVGYVVRALLMPDVTSGRVVIAVLVVALCVAVAAGAMGHVPLWAPLLGAAAFTGSYEHVYAAEPTQVASTSISAVTMLLITVAVGYFASLVAAPEGDRSEPRHADRGPRSDSTLDDMLGERTR